MHVSKEYEKASKTLEEQKGRKEKILLLHDARAKDLFNIIAYNVNKIKFLFMHQYNLLLSAASYHYFKIYINSKESIKIRMH